MMKNKVIVIGILALTLAFTLLMSSCSGKGINSPEELKKYLDSRPANSPDKPIKVTIIVNDQTFKSFADVIKSAGKYVNINFSGGSLTTIPAYAFFDVDENEDTYYGCELLVSITMPNSVTGIEGFAFADCTGLTSVTIPKSVTSIGAAAFCDCTGLTGVTIPNSVESIKEGAFIGCTNLSGVTFQGASSNFEYYYIPPFAGDLRDKYLDGGIGTYTTTAPVDFDSTWTKK